MFIRVDDDGREGEDTFVTFIIIIDSEWLSAYEATRFFCMNIFFLNKTFI